MPYHCLLRLKNNGNCTELKGRVLLYDVFVDDSLNKWSEQEIQFQRGERKQVANYLKQEALKDSVQLSFFQMEKRIHILEQVTHKTGANECKTLLAKKCGYSSLQELFLYLKNHYQVDQIVFTFLINKEGRSFAYADERQSYNSGESLFLFKSNAYAMMHELLHLFGAVDYYYPKEVAKLAREHFPNSVMLESKKFEIDDLTRYLIGWHKRPTAVAQYMLNATAMITREAFLKANSSIWEADYTEIEYTNSVYYGPVKNGMRHGKGKLVFHEGSVYEGDFVNGRYHGQGKITFPNGTVYEGGFANGEYDGWGKLIYSNGVTEKCFHERGKRIK